MAGSWRTIDGPAGALRVYSTPAPPGRFAEPAVVLCHELARRGAAAVDAGRAYPALADRLAEECGCRVVAGMLRGAGGSDGDFSASGWLADLGCVLDAEFVPGATVWLVGFGLGAALALRTAASDERVQGVASVAGPADLGAWAADPVQLVNRCRASGVVRRHGFPPDLNAWAAELVALAPLEAVTHLGRRPLLVVHGSDDSEVPVASARALADGASGPGTVDLRIVPGAGHWLRADPRVVATLVGWIERRR